MSAFYELHLLVGPQTNLMARDPSKIFENRVTKEINQLTILQQPLVLPHIKHKHTMKVLQVFRSMWSPKISPNN